MYCSFQENNFACKSKKGKHCGSFKLRNTVHKIDWDVTGTRVGAAVGPFGVSMF